jgi:uncharacterized membrane protein HdeD (DUF308 family)
MMPALALVFWAAFRLAPTAAGQRIGRRMFKRAPEAVTSPEEFDRYRTTYDAVVLGVVMLLLGLHAAVLAMAWEAPHVAARIVPAVLGGSLVLMGNVMPRLRPNWVAGIRTQRVLEKPQLWRSTHRAFGTAFVVTGFVTILAAVVAPQYGLLVGIVSLMVSCIVGFVASTRHGNTATCAALLGLGLLCTAVGAIPAQAPPDAQNSSEVIAPATVTESRFTIVHNGFALDGMLAMRRSAADRVPVVLIVAGSGLTDRNSTGATGGYS